MENATRKSHQKARRAERKALAAGLCALFSKNALRRVTALLLVTALAFGMTVTAMAQQVDPIQVTDPAEFPTITVETNLVMNEASGLPDIITDGTDKYGFVEVALRVTPGTSGLFSGAALALTYDEQVLTPVTWNQLDEATQKRDKYDVVAPGANPYDTFLPTKKADIISTASAYIGGTDGAGKSLLYLNAESEYPTTLTGDSRLAVVRFRYDATANPLTYDATAKEIQNAGIPVTFVGWASDANAALSPAGANAYFTGKNEPTVRESMYYIHKDPNPAAWTKIDAGGLSMPNTVCQQLVKAVDPSGTNPDSYSTNFFPVDQTYIDAINAGTSGFGAVATPLTDPKIQFTQITAATADQGSGGISLDDLSTILFYDWDDTLLGALTVPRGVDVREEVNTYVRENFIHPDLQYDKAGKEGAANLSLIDNVQRTNSYRGTFPHDNPGGAENTGNFVTNGGDYPLTNKLDYVFFKRPATFSVPDDIWFFDANYNAEYPYIYGWINIANQAALADYWSTFGVGELSEYYPDEGGFMTGANASYFEFVDFTELQNSTVYVKALYEPSATLQVSEYTETPFKYSRYGINGSNLNGTYSIQFKYQRVNSGHGVKRMREPSVRTTFLPDVTKGNVGTVNGLTSLYTDLVDLIGPDFSDIFPSAQDMMDAYSISGATVGSFYNEYQLKNIESMSVDLTPSSAVQSVEYILVDKYGYNSFVEAPQRSAANGNGVLYNFDQTAAFAERQGTDGYVFYCSLGALLEQGSLKAQSKSNTYDTSIDENLFKDLNLRYNATTEFDTMWAILGRNALATAISQAIVKGWIDDRGYADLSWHQLQYYLIHNSLVDKTTAKNENYAWYRGPV